MEGFIKKNLRFHELGNYIKGLLEGAEIKIYIKNYVKLMFIKGITTEGQTYYKLLMFKMYFMKGIKRYE
ncbi:hypothetical protein bsdtw1_00661 [Clostridium fungisolvens]|uniref:Uncharacterized protein n=1 Tax=Clostridium fungisolvens TaxID=1604897 RepID=A0A6V8SD43_9CLOT|nr:hypothetical protein bsdtw1_00661 [Clostridium fungisolvens]